MSQTTNTEIHDLELVLVLVPLVYSEPGLTGRQYTAILKRGDSSIYKHRVNSCLSRNKGFFDDNRDERGIPAWTISDSLNDAITASGNKKAKEERQEKSLVLRSWQTKAYDAWVSNEYKGIIEASKFSGKKTLAIRIISDHLSLGYKIAIIVTGKNDISMWKDLLINSSIVRVDDRTIGVMGDGECENLASHKILLSTMRSASKYQLGLSKNEKGLLIVDECQNVATGSLSNCLEDTFSRRLGLSSICYRTDNGIADYLLPYFNEVVYEYPVFYSFLENLISPIDLKFVQLDFTDEEKVNYFKNLEIRNKNRTGEIDGAQVDWSNYADPLAYLKSTESKIKYFSEKVSEIDKYRKVLIYSESTFLTQTWEQTLLKHKIGYLDVTGTKGSTLEESLTDFRNNSVKVLITNHISNAYNYEFGCFDFCLISGCDNNEGRLDQKLSALIQPISNMEACKVELLYIKDSLDDPMTGAYTNYWDLFGEKKIENKRPINNHQEIVPMECIEELEEITEPETFESGAIEQEADTSTIYPEFTWTNLDNLGNDVQIKNYLLEAYSGEEPIFRIPKKMDKARISVLGALAGKKDDYYNAAEKIGINRSFLDFYDYHLDGKDVDETIKDSTSDVIVGPHAHCKDISNYFRKNRKNLPKEINARKDGKDLKLSINCFVDALKRSYKYSYMMSKS